MSNVRKSKLLTRLMESARTFAGKGNGAVTAEKLIISAIEMIDSPPLRLGAEEKRELRQVAELLNKYGTNPEEMKTQLQQHVLYGSGTTYSDILYIQGKLREANALAQELERDELSADMLLRCIIRGPSETLRSLFTSAPEAVTVQAPAMTPET